MWFRRTFQKSLESNHFDENLWDCTSKDAWKFPLRAASKSFKVLQTLSDIVVRSSDPWSDELSIFAPNILKFGCCVFGDLVLDVTGVTLVELGEFPTIEVDQLSCRRAFG